jgi:hypothetical protein
MHPNPCLAFEATHFLERLCVGLGLANRDGVGYGP